MGHLGLSKHGIWSGSAVQIVHRLSSQRLPLTQILQSIPMLGHGGFSVQVELHELGPEGSEKIPVTSFGQHFHHGIFCDLWFVKAAQGICIQSSHPPIGADQVAQGLQVILQRLKRIHRYIGGVL
ncbi:hypothetical protein NPIL_640221 [Nephila pilipes]|uniref:Uncharacterized protein n=1 Tax=Nephila pilipes TaxID=299642 RepID=A0A8X6TPL4_NEPPI|nr:hypothetical protein NPIL_640221 [Nephila pilipes]